VLVLDSLDAGRLPREYIVKHFRVNQRLAKVTEYLGARFAFETGINAIEPVIIEFTSQFLEDLAQLPEPPRDLQRAEPGLHVGFEWNHAAICLMESHRTLDSLEYPGQVGEIIGVDTVLVNFDRSKENVLVEPAATDRGMPAHLLHPIDWDLCFAGGISDYEVLKSEALLVSKRPWTDDKSSEDPLCSRINSSDDFVGILSKLGSWSGAKAHLQLLVQGLPREWRVTASEQAVLVSFLLRRVETTLARLKQSSDPDRVFPNWQGSLPLDSTA
jgi:hypothetical protein